MGQALAQKRIRAHVKLERLRGSLEELARTLATAEPEGAHVCLMEATKRFKAKLKVSRKLGEASKAH